MRMQSSRGRIDTKSGHAMRAFLAGRNNRTGDAITPGDVQKFPGRMRPGFLNSLRKHDRTSLVGRRVRHVDIKLHQLVSRGGIKQPAPMHVLLARFSLGGRPAAPPTRQEIRTQTIADIFLRCSFDSRSLSEVKLQTFLQLAHWSSCGGNLAERRIQHRHIRSAPVGIVSRVECLEAKLQPATFQNWDALGGRKAQVSDTGSNQNIPPEIADRAKRLQDYRPCVEESVEPQECPAIPSPRVDRRPRESKGGTPAEPSSPPSPSQSSACTVWRFQLRKQRSLLTRSVVGHSP